MASKAGIFFAGVGTTFLILGAGFGGGLLMANNALQESPIYKSCVAPPAAPWPVRVIFPSTAEAAQPPQPPVQQVAAGPESATPQPQLQPAGDTHASAEKQVEKADAKAEAAQKERRKRYAERKAKRQAAERARRQQQQVAQGERWDAPVMAFGGDEPASRPFSLFGND